MDKWMTTGQIADAVAERYPGASYSRVVWVLKTRATIAPAGQIGAWRAFAPSAVDMVLKELVAIDGRKKQPAQ